MTTTTAQPSDLDPIRLKHDSYSFTDAGNNYQTAYEVADTLEDYFSLARTDKLDESQVNEFAKFLDDDQVFRVAVIMVPEVARLAGEDYWVQGRDDGKRSPQVVHILHAIAHREPRSRRLSRPAEDIIETNEQKAELLRQTRDMVDGTNADIEAIEDAEGGGLDKPASQPRPDTKIQTDEVTTVGDLIRSRQDAGRISWKERHSRT